MCRGLAKLDGQHAADFLAQYTTPEEVMELPGSCYVCHEPTATRMFMTSIPFFKEVLIMSNSCDSCGYRNAEVKSGGGV